MHGSISKENISFSRNFNIKSTNAKCHACFYLGRNSDTLEIEHCLLNSPIMDFISGQLTNPIHRITGQFINKPGKRLFCDRSLLMLVICA